VKNRFQSLPFKFSLQRYNEGGELRLQQMQSITAGLYTLNPVDP
jgi:hypothetical protein